MKKLLLLSAVLIGAATASQAGVRFNLGIGIPLPPPIVVTAPCAPAYQPAPQVCEPAPQVCEPAPQVYAPAPVVCAPPRVVVASPVIRFTHVNRAYRHAVRDDFHHRW